VQRWRQIEKDAKDKIAPDADKAVQPATPRTGQKSELPMQDPVYGALPDTLDAHAVSSFAGLSFMGEPAEAAITRLSSLEAAPDAGQTAAVQASAAPATPPQAVLQTSDKKDAVARSPKPLTGFSMGPGVDDLALAMPGPNGRPSAADALDGPAPPVDPAEVAQAQAQDKSGFLTPEARRAAEQKAHDAQASKQIAHAIFDVSEGTPLDPLLDKTYDLNSPKTVPSLK
jgi:UPF0755 protein